MVKCILFDEIVSCELITQVNSVTTTKGSISRTVVGGMIAGGIGAMVGAGTSAKETMSTTEITEIKIYFNDVDYPSRTLNLPAEYALSIYDSLYIVFAQKRSEVALNKGTEEYQDIESSAFCSKCGANVQSDDLYCRKCGIRLT